MPGDYYTWSEFDSVVNELLPIEARRKGVGNTGTSYFTRLKRQAVLDLQGAIPGYCINHETIYYQDDMVREGLACRLVKPPQSALRSIWLFKVVEGEDTVRRKAIPYPWEKRFDLVNGQVPTNDGYARYAVDPAGYTVYVYPMIDGEPWMVSLFWDGQKLDFQDDEQVPFPERAALAVSYFVKANTSIEVEDGIQNSVFYKQAYADEKTKLYLDDKDRQGKV